MVTDTYDLTQLNLGGMVNEDVMQRIFDISDIPLPLTSRISSGSHSNPYTEWPVDRLQTPDLTNADNAVIDGSTGRADDSSHPTYARVGNHSQISVRRLDISTRSNESGTIGFARTLAYQIMMRGNELRRNVEAIMLSSQGSVEDTGAGGNAGNVAGLEAWITDEDELGNSIISADVTAAGASQYRNVGTGAITISGWPNATGNIIADVGYGSVSAVGALTEESIKDVVEQLYQNGADPTVLMARPPVVRRLSEFMFTSSARVATLTNQDGAASTAQRVAQGSVNVMVTDFSVLEIVPNRLQQQSGDGTPDTDTVFIFDPNFLQQSFLHGYRTVELGKTGLTEIREVQVDWTLKCMNWGAVGGVLSVDDSAAVTA